MAPEVAALGRSHDAGSQVMVLAAMTALFLGVWRFSRD
jgi:hypothetical protein